MRHFVLGCGKIGDKRKEQQIQEAEVKFEYNDKE